MLFGKIILRRSPVVRGAAFGHFPPEEENHGEMGDYGHKPADGIGDKKHLQCGLEGENGFYLTSMCPDNNHDCWGRNHYSYNIEFGSEYQRINYVIRYYGCSVRPVAE